MPGGGGGATEGGRTRTFDLLAVDEGRHEALRYLAAAGLIASVIAGAAFALEGRSRDATAVEAENAVMVDLPAADASSRRASDAEEGPERSAAAARASASDAPSPDAPDGAKPDPVPDPAPPHTQAHTQDGVPILEQPAEPAQASKPAEAPSPGPAPQPETAPAGSLSPEGTRDVDGEDARPHPSAHAITLWQQALMRRFEGARRHFPVGAGPTGTATIGFSIGERGELLTEHVASSSGSRRLDAMALQLVKRAAPFPTPPAGSRDGDLSFTIPVRFR